MTVIAHQSPGRLRLQLDDIKQEPERAQAALRHLCRRPGLGPGRISTATGSVVLRHDENWSPTMVVDEFDELWAGPWRSPAPSDDDGGGDGRPGLELAASAGSLVLSVATDALVPLKLGLLAVGGRSILRRTATSVVGQRRLTVDALDTAAVGLLAAQGLFPYAAFITTMVTTAEVIRSATQERSRRAIAEVMGDLGAMAWVEREGAVVEVDADDVSVGEIIVVSAGDRVPVDGVVVEGKIVVDQHALTGESVPVERDAGDEVFATTAVADGRARIVAEGVGRDTRVAQVVDLIATAPTHDTRVQNYAERWANRLVPFSFVASGAALVTGGVTAAATVLVIDYGAAFRVAAPTTIMSSMTRAASAGILIKGGRHLEQLAEIDALVVDKTGTLTRGCPGIATTLPFNGATPDQVLTMAAAAEHRLNHPVADALVAAASDAGLELPERQDWEYTVGQGVEAIIDGQSVLVGSHRFLHSRGIPTPDSWRNELVGIERRAMSPLCVAINGEHYGAMALADPIRPESAEVIAGLRRRGIGHIAMVTGDRRAVADEVARQVGIDTVVAEAFPEAKLEVVADLQARGFTVGVVGDGINDAPALANADVGIAVNGGTATAQESADVVLLQGDLQKLPEAIDIARNGIDLVRQNWQLIRLPNSVGLGLALLGRIGPAGASLISDGAAIAAGLNSLRPLAGVQREDRRP
ncbi:MAG: heavy metal translocating P-type ATPase [Actinomycetota bacterium]